MHQTRHLARAAALAARAVLRQAAVLFAALLLGAVGAGFLIHAGYTVLRLSVGAETAAAVTGVALIVLAVVLAWVAGRIGGATRAAVATPPPAPAAAAPGNDPAKLAVFTLAYVLGRRLADRNRD